MDKFTKRVFLSVPMKGREDNDILKDLIYLWKAAELRWGEKLVPVHNLCAPKGTLEKDIAFNNATINELLELIDNPPMDIPEGTCNIKAFYVSEAIKKMSTCDYFIGFSEARYGSYKGCEIESKVAGDYDIPRYFIDYPGEFPWYWEEEETIKPDDISNIGFINTNPITISPCVSFSKCMNKPNCAEGSCENCECH